MSGTIALLEIEYAMNMRIFLALLLMLGMSQAFTFQGTGSGLNQQIRLEISQGGAYHLNFSFSNLNRTFWFSQFAFTPNGTLWNYSCSISIGGEYYIFPDTKTKFHGCGDSPAIAAEAPKQYFNTVQYPLETIASQRTDYWGCNGAPFAPEYVAALFEDEANNCLLMNFELPYDFVYNDSAKPRFKLNWIALDGGGAGEYGWEILYRCQRKCQKYEVDFARARFEEHCEGDNGNPTDMCLMTDETCAGMLPGDKIQVWLRRRTGDESSSAAMALTLTMVYTSNGLGATTIWGSSRQTGV